VIKALDRRRRLMGRGTGSEDSGSTDDDERRAAAALATSVPIRIPGVRNHVVSWFWVLALMRMAGNDIGTGTAAPAHQSAA
jgi:hypothetical protein